MSHDAAIEVAGLRKAFRLPRHQVHTLKERALHPVRRVLTDELGVLSGISFAVHRGEFFGVVGRNGSGKSTLLKCLAGIYRPDAGKIWVAGRLAPFIELGVGFNPDLTARDNVVINAVMMGLTPREARRRFDAIMDFADLREFVDLKLKNYSSGMQVRLAFSVMVESQSDILLVDEVLAVGDAAFQQKCLDVFYGLREQGRTIVLVTHDMAMVERFCHRALLLYGGKIAHEGPPDEVGRRYLALNFEAPEMDPGRPAESADQRPTQPITVDDVWIEDDSGERTGGFAPGERIHLHAALRSHERIQAPHVIVWIDSPERTRIFGAGSDSRLGSALESGEHLHVHVALDNPLAPNHYVVGCSVTTGSSRANLVAWAAEAAGFVVYSGGEHHGLVSLDHTVEIHRRPADTRWTAPTAGAPDPATGTPR